MTNESFSLLPEGFRDRLPPHAARHAALSRAMLDVLASYGYERVAPPLVEFEETLTRRSGDGGRNGLLRVTDPVSGRTLAMRSDITKQVGRMAGSRLAAAPRPLRLCYQGQILRLHANQLRPEREMSQLGAELIGNDGVPAVSETLSLAVEALEAAGVVTLMPRWAGLVMRQAVGRPTRSFKNLCQESGIPSWLRDRLPVLRVDDQVAWIGELGEAADFRCGDGEPGVLPVWRR